MSKLCRVTAVNTHKTTPTQFVWWEEFLDSVYGTLDDNLPNASSLCLTGTHTYIEAPDLACNVLPSSGLQVSCVVGARG